MREQSDIYKTILKPSKEVLYKEKGSKFFGYAYPVTNENEVKEILDTLKKQHHSARHFCYAWQLGKTYNHYRINDDGEPSNSAGAPIYGQIQAFEVTNVLVVVVRYFGGTKLGVGGLIQAYKTAAKMALESAKIIAKTIDTAIQLTFGYSEMNTVMRIVKAHNLQIISQELNTECKLIVAIRKKDAENVINKFKNTYKVQVKVLKED